VIVDLPRFVAAEKPYWEELEIILAKLDASPEQPMTLPEVRRLHYLYERCSAGLANLDTFSTEPRLRTLLESLVSRAYGEIHETRPPLRLRWKMAVYAFPRAFRRHRGAFRLAVGITILGSAFGWFAVHQDPQSKAVLMPFPGLMVSPKDRVAMEESSKLDRLSGVKATFSAELMTHNIQVAVLTMASGVTWGIGTLILLFYNGVILGAVGADYVGTGQSAFLLGWLLPHGSVEIPAILLGGQAGLILAGALIGWGSGLPRAARLRAVAADLFTIVAGAACLLVWAGLIEAFVSQYHQPVLPYELKIAFGACELMALFVFLEWTGRE
jgi:uncharacterized membrane protein SpoIIM required for sporulation